MDRFDVCIAGAGVIGLAIARQLARDPKRTQQRLLLLDSGDKIGEQISSRNSEVIHAGLYYPPGSLKATLCVRGKQLLYEYCQRHDERRGPVPRSPVDEVAHCLATASR